MNYQEEKQARIKQARETLANGGYIYDIEDGSKKRSSSFRDVILTKKRENGESYISILRYNYVYKDVYPYGICSLEQYIQKSTDEEVVDMVKQYMRDEKIKTLLK